MTRTSYCLFGAALLGLVAASASAQTTEYAQFTNLVDSGQGLGAITRIKGTAGWAAGGVSTRAIASGDGWVQFIAGPITDWRAIGLSNGDGGQDFADIDHAWYLSAGQLKIYESGAFRGDFGWYAASDLLRVEVEAGVVKFKQNGSLIYASSVAPTYPLLIDTSLNTPGVPLYGIVLSATNFADVGVAPPAFSVPAGDYTTAQSVAVSVSSGGVSTVYYTTDGTPPTTSSPQVSNGGTVTVSQHLALRARAFKAGLYDSDVTTARYTIGMTRTLEDATWINLVEATGSPGSIERSSGTTGWAGGVSSNAIVSVDGHLQFRAGPTTHWRLIGLGNGDTNQDWTDIEHAFYLAGDQLKVYESGYHRGDFGTYSATDLLKIAIVNGAVKYYKNGTLILHSAMPTKYTALVDTALTTIGVATNEIQLEGGLLPSRSATPTFSPTAGAYVPPLSVSLCAAQGQCTPQALIPIRYTTDGSEPTSASTLYTAPIAVTTSPLTIKAKAFALGFLPSDTASATYSLKLAPPGISPGSGTYTTAQTVTLDCPTTACASISYSLNGQPPQTASPPVQIAVSTQTTLSATASSSGWTDSAPATAEHFFDYGTVETPSFDPPGGTHTTFQNVVVSTATAGAVIHYTLNGVDPTTSDPTVASGGSVAIDRYRILKAKAFKTDYSPSAVGRADYVITGAVVGGTAHALALDAQGNVWVWGENADGRLGLGVLDTTDRPTPEQIPSTSLADVVAVAAGEAHSLAVTREGKVYAFGSNYYGQLGVGDQNDRHVPTEVTGLPADDDVVAVAAGYAHSLALTKNNKVWVWGYNSTGQLGDGTANSHLEPYHLTSLTGIAQIAASHATSYALKTDGAASGVVWSWGHNIFGQLGNGGFATEYSPISGLPSGLNIVLIAPGNSATGAPIMAVDSSGALWGWSSNAYGQLVKPIDPPNPPTPTPARLGVPPGFSSLAFSYAHVLGVRPDGGVWGWGSNAGNVLGPDPNVAPGGSVFLLRGIGDVHSVAAQVQTVSIALKRDGWLWTWGTGWLGDDTPYGAPRATPAQLGLRLVENDELLVDADGDGLSNGTEYRLGTDPLNADTNGDGIPDGAAHAAGLDPKNPDMDGDGLSNVAEIQKGTDPFRADTDDDGTNDLADCFPLDPTRWQCPPPVGGDTTPPVITLQQPTNATLISVVPPIP